MQTPGPSPGAYTGEWAFSWFSLNHRQKSAESGFLDPQLDKHKIVLRVGQH